MVTDVCQKDISYHIRPGNGEGLFWFLCFVNLSLTYLLRQLPIYLQPRDPHGAELSRVLLTHCVPIHIHMHIKKY